MNNIYSCTNLICMYYEKITNVTTLLKQSSMCYLFVLVNHEYDYLFGFQEEGDSTYKNVDPAMFNEISDMLNMVSQSNESQPMVNNNSSEALSSRKSRVVIFSKLNPDVEDFRPAMTSVDNSEIDLTVKKMEELKKVIDEPKGSSIKKKKVRNVAIANIMRLKSLSNESSVKLMTPQDFIHSPEENVSQEKIEPLASTSISYKKVAIQSPKSTLELEIDNKSVEGMSGERAEGDKEDLAEVKESIKKVKKWLGMEAPETATLERINSRGLTYTVVQSNSPTASLPVPETSVSSSVLETATVKKFVPTGNTSLYNQYVQNAKVISERDENMWDKLEHQLKELDKKKNDV